MAIIRKLFGKKSSAKKAAATQEIAPAEAPWKRIAKKEKASPKSGRRCTDQEKTEVVRFVRDHEKTHGRGGQTLAVK